MQELEIPSTAAFSLTLPFNITHGADPKDAKIDLR
jgi:hypothetical protein